MNEIEDVSAVELSKIIGGSKPRKKGNKHALCPYVSVGLAVAGGLLSGGNPLGAAGGFATGMATSYCN